MKPIKSSIVGLGTRHMKRRKSASRKVHFGTVDTCDYAQVVYKGANDKRAKIRLGNSVVNRTRNRRLSAFEVERAKYRREAADLRLDVADIGELLQASSTVAVDSPRGFVVNKKGEVLMGHAGWLNKQSVHSRVLTNWRRRYFRLRPDGVFTYSVTADYDDIPRGFLRMTSQTRASRVSFQYFHKPYCILMTGLVDFEHKPAGFFGHMIGLKYRQRPLKLALQCSSEAERNKWLEEMRTVYQHIVTTEKDQLRNAENRYSAEVQIVPTKNIKDAPDFHDHQDHSRINTDSVHNTYQHDNPNPNTYQHDNPNPNTYQHDKSYDTVPMAVSLKRPNYDDNYDVDNIYNSENSGAPSTVENSQFTLNTNNSNNDMGPLHSMRVEPVNEELLQLNFNRNNDTLHSTNNALSNPYPIPSNSSAESLALLRSCSPINIEPNRRSLVQHVHFQI